MEANLYSNRIEFIELGGAITLAGSDIVSGSVIRVDSPDVPGNAVTFVRLVLCGDAAAAYGPHYDIDFRNLTNQPTWTTRVDTEGAFTCLTDITPIFRRPISTGGGGGQVDSVVPGDAIDVDSTDPVNPIVSVKVDGVTVGFNGSNELEVPAGGGGYVPTTRLINTTAPLTGGGDLSANRTLAIPQASAVTDGFLDAADWTTFNDKGDVNGPGSATDDHVALFDGASGKLIKDSGYTPGGLVIPTGFGDIDLIETSPGFWPVEIKGGLDGDATEMQSNTGSFQVNVKVDGITIGINGSNELESLVTDTGITQLTADVTAGPGSGSQAATIANDAVTNAKLANMAQATIKGRQSASGTGDPEDLTDTQARAIILAQNSQRVLFNQATTLTNQPNSLEILTSALPGIFISRIDTTGFTEVMLQIHVFVASASGNSPRIILGYSSSYSVAPGSYSDIGTSAVTCSMSSTGVIQSAWIPLAAGAIGDIYITPLSSGGNGAADPQIQGGIAFFR